MSSYKLGNPPPPVQSQSKLTHSFYNFYRSQCDGTLVFRTQNWATRPKKESDCYWTLLRSENYPKQNSF